MAITAERLEIQVDASGADTAAAELSAIKGAAMNAKAGIAVLGGALAALSAGGIVKAVKSAAEFESTLVELEKVTSRGVAQELKSDLIELTRTIPMTANELTNLAADAARFGVPEDQILSFTETVAKMATATDLSAEEAGEAFAKLAVLTETPIPKVENLGSAINALSNNAATSSSEIVDNMMRSAGALSSLGMTNTEIVGLAGSLNEVTPNAAYAGTQLARLAEQMVDPRKVQDLARALGMTVQEYKAQVQNDPTGMIIALASAMKEGGDAADILNTTLTATSRKALRGLGQNLQGTKENLDLTARAFRENTSLQSEFEAAVRTVESQLQFLKNAVEEVAIATGTVLLPAVGAILLAVKEAIQLFADFNNATNGMAGAVALVSGLVGGLAAAFAGLATMIPAGAITAAATAFLTVVGPVAALTAAVGALAMAFHTDFAGIRTATMNVVSVLRNEFLPIFTMLKSTVGVIIRDLAAAFTSTGSQIQSSISGIVTSIEGTLIRGIRSAAQSAFELLAQLGMWWNNHKQTVITAIQSIVSGVSRGFNLVATIVRDVASAFQGSGVDIQAVISQIGSALGSILIVALQTLGRVTNQVVTAMAQWWRSNGDTVISIIRSIVSAAGAFINALVRIMGPVGRLASALGSVLIPVLEGVWEGFKLVWAPIVRLLRPALSWLASFVTGTVAPAIISLGPHIDRLATSIEQWAARNQGLLTSIGKVIGVIVGLLAPIGQLIGVLGRVIGFVARLIPGFTRLIGVFTRTGGAVSRLISWFVQLGARAVNAVIGGITRTWNTLQRFIAIAVRTGQTVRNLVASFIQFGTRATQAVVRAFSRIRNAITGAMRRVSNIISTGWNKITSRIANAVRKIWGHIQGTWNKIRSFTNRWANTLARAIGGLVDDIIGFFQDLKRKLIGGSIVPEMLNGITRAFDQFIRNVVRSVQRFVGDIVGKFTDLKNQTTNRANEIKTQVVRKFNELQRQATQSVERMKRDLVRKFEEAKRQAVSKTKTLVRDVTSKLNDLAGSALKAGKGMANALAKGIRNAAGKAVNAATSLAKKIRKKLPGSDAREGPLSDLTAAGAALPETLAQGILGNRRKLSAAAETIAQAFKAPIDRMADELKSIFDDLGTLVSRTLANIGQQVSGGTRTVRNRTAGAGAGGRAGQLSDAELLKLMPQGFLGKGAKYFKKWFNPDRMGGVGGAHARRRRLRKVGYTIENFRKRLEKLGGVASMTRREIAQAWQDWTGIIGAAEGAMRGFTKIGLRATQETLSETPAQQFVKSNSRVMSRGTAGYEQRNVNVNIRFQSGAIQGRNPQDTANRVVDETVARIPDHF